MKKLLLMLLTLVVFASCSKEEEIVPIQKVTYSVDCKNCLVYVDDNLREGQHFVVSGKWTYSFENTKRDSVKMTIYTSVLQKGQQVKASIKTNNRLEVKVDKFFGMDENLFRPVTLDTTVVLKLK